MEIRRIRAEKKSASLPVERPATVQQQALILSESKFSGFAIRSVLSE
jgi:hypothetical protein